jgi:hypothetical protein
MKLSNTTSFALGVAFLAALAQTAVASQETDRGAGLAKAAAHASLIERADVPQQPPRLPDGVVEAPRQRAPGIVAGKRAEAARKAQAEAQLQGEDAAHAAHVEAANRAAQGSAASAARNANADEHAAAGQARAQAARARAGKPDSPGNSGNAPGKNK